MAGKSRSEIIKDIEALVKKSNSKCESWVVGVTSDPRFTLSKQHNVGQQGDSFIARCALDDLQANEVVDYFTSVQGSIEGVRVPGVDSVHVYAYKPRPHTKP